jgi:hypothetical protein
MKKLVLFISALLTAGAISAQTDCSDIFISEYVEGWNNNKAIELYNPTQSAITLDNAYRIIRWSNGSSTADADPMYVYGLKGTIDPFKVQVLIQDTIPAGQDTMVWPDLRKHATALAPYDYNGTTPGGKCVFWNGDDAISIQKLISGTWTDIDIFGEIGIRPTNWQGTYSPSGAWTDTKPYITGAGIYLTKSKSLVRKASVKHGVDRATMIHYGDTATGGVPNSFNARLEYDTLSVNYFDSLGTHTCACKSSAGIGKLNGNRNFVISPNPVSGNHFTVQASQPVASVEIVSIVGQTVFSREFTTRQQEVKITSDNLHEGVYLVRVTFGDNQSVTKKIIVQ